MTYPELVDYVRKHPGKTPRQLRHSIWRQGISTADIRKAMAEVEGDVPVTVKGLPPASFASEPAGRRRSQAVPLPGSAGVSPATAPISQLLDQFDEVKKTRDAVRAMPKDHYISDEDLRRRLHISPDRWRSVVQHPDVSPYRYRLPNNRMVWMHPAAQETLNARIRME